MTLNLRLNLRSDAMDVSRSGAFDVKTSSVSTDAPAKDDSLSWRWIVEKSCEDSPLTVSTVTKKLRVLPVGKV